MVAMAGTGTKIIERRVSLVRGWKDGVTFPEALRLVQGRSMLDNKEADQILQDPTLRAGLIGMFPVWTGTMVAYNAPGNCLGSTIAANGLTIHIPPRYQNAVNCALFVTHPNFTLAQQRGGYIK